MIYRIVHKTTYEYENPVSFGNHSAYLTPRSEAWQMVRWSRIEVSPAPASEGSRIDYHGNRLSFFTIQEPHERLEITASSELDLGAASPLPTDSPAWDEYAAALPESEDPGDLDAYQFVFESPRIRLSEEFAEYAAPSFRKGRPLVQSVLDLTARIYREFRFDSKATSVRTPPEDVLHEKRGVCQDFAQVQIACLRSLGLPARYVSGYLRTEPPPGKPRLVGADASHAWVSVYCPGWGWLDCDPTNNVVPDRSHVTLAWGRDYSDVSPVRGVILGGREHLVKVAVDMEPVG